VLSEGNANVASEVKRIFFGGGLVFAGIAILAGTNPNVVQNAETEIVRDIDAIEQGAAKGVINVEKDIVKDMKLSPELAAAAKRAVTQQEAAEKEDSADEYGSVAEESSSADTKKEIAPEQVARRKAERTAKAEDKRIPKANVSPEKARAKAAAKADRMRREDERATLEAGAADEYGAIDEDKAGASEARINKAAAEAKARLDKAAAQEKAEKEQVVAPPAAAPAPAPSGAQDTQAAEAKLQAEKEAATKVIAMPEGVKDQLKGGSSKSSGASFTVYSSRL